MKIDFNQDEEYLECIRDIIEHEVVAEMKKFIQHGNESCLEHCRHVSYISYLVCKRLGLDYRSAARGGLLHDFFLYDWHIEKPPIGIHGFIHPFIAFENARDYFHLNDREKDIITKHMWPLTLRLPRYKETFIVLMADKYCTLTEVTNISFTPIIQRVCKQN